jgi:N6-L-threonylcarbamoyladenine synthase
MRRRTCVSWLQAVPGRRPHVRFAGRPPLFLVQRALTTSAQSDRPTRPLLTLAIETSCDDTCVAILSKAPGRSSATLHFNEKVTSDNRAFGGVHPIESVEGHTTSLAKLVQKALRSLPAADVQSGEDAIIVYSDTENSTEKSSLPRGRGQGGRKVWRRRPDFVTVTRGPGMTSNLAAGLNTAKGLATAWAVPLVGVNHMQAHALTPRLVTALENGKETQTDILNHTPTSTNVSHEPSFPFLSLLVSGGHTLLVHSRSLTNHQILLSAANIAIGDAIDKCARLILPPDYVASATDVMYGRLLEEFAFPPPQASVDYKYNPPARRAEEIAPYTSPTGWTLLPPLAETRRLQYDFSGLLSQVQRALSTHPDMDRQERRLLAQQTMRIAFEHLAGRMLLALGQKASSGAKGKESELASVDTLVVSGGVASNRYLTTILRGMLDIRGYGYMKLVAPPPGLCTDNAAMIAWAGMELFEAGWETDLSVLAMRKWPVDPESEGGGIMGANGWIQRY